MTERMAPAPPTMTVYWRAEVRKTESGKLVRRTRKYRSRSFVNNFLRLMRINAANSSASVTALSSTSYTVPVSTTSWALTTNPTGLNADDIGIIAGTGNTAVDGSDTDLDTRILTGTSSGQLDYTGGTTVGSLAAGASITSFDISRGLANSSGGSINVEEIGLAINWTVSGNLRSFLIIRDLTGTIAVADGETLTITYTIKTTV